LSMVTAYCWIYMALQVNRTQHHNNLQRCRSQLTQLSEQLPTTKGLQPEQSTMKLTGTIGHAFRGCFGLAPHLAAELWNMLDDEDPLSDIRWVTYFLATLMFLRTYTVTAVLAMIFMKDEKTIRHWVWVFIEKIATLDLVRDNQASASTFSFLHCRLHKYRDLTMYMLQSTITAAPDQMGEQTDE
ncbi:unknown protein (Partial), partial [Seminavis robusta]